MYQISKCIFPTFYVTLTWQSLSVNPPLKIFQTFLSKDLLSICILGTGKKFWKKKKELLRSKFERCLKIYDDWRICQSYFYYTLIFRSRFRNKSGTRLHSYRIASFIEMHYAMVFLLLFKGNAFYYCARINRISLRSIVVKTVNSKFQEDF